MHDSDALARSQVLPQPPQLARFVLVSTSQPLVALPSQLAKPALQAPRVHTPLLQVSLAFG